MTAANLEAVRVKLVPLWTVIALALVVAAVSACGAAAGSGAAAVGAKGSSAFSSAKKKKRGLRPIPDGDWTRFDYDAARSGAGPPSTGITRFNLHALKRRAIHIDGVADSSPVELHNVPVAGRSRDVAFVTTTYGRTVAFDPGTGQKLWEYSPADIGKYIGSPQVTTASPVVDPDRAFVYAASPDGFIHKLAVSSGREVHSGGWPARVTFDASREKIGGALNVSGSNVLVGTGGYYGDQPTYQGHVVSIATSTGQITHVWNSLCSDRHGLIDPPSSCPASDSAIWARAGVVVEPGTGRVILATGNGPFNGSTNWGDSVLELAPGASGLLQNWTPTNQAQLNSSDTDLGSTAPALLPRVHGLRLAVQGGKQGVLDLLNLDRLNGTTHASGHLGGELQQISGPGGGEILTAPAVWRRGGRTFVFVADFGATAGYVLTGGAKPRLRVAWKVSTPGTSPIVAGGLLYVYDGENGKLDVRDPRTGRLRAALGAANGHWNSPIALGGRIILPVGGSTADSDTSGTIYVYHLPGR